jgi:transcriptional regulator with XRE-family HTH domain
MATFGEWLRQQRTAAGYTQTQLARKIGFDQSTISAIELDAYKPTHKFAFALATALGLDVEVVLELAGIGAESVEVDERARAELLSVFDQLSDDDQSTLIELARALRRQEQKRGRGKTAPA